MKKSLPKNIILLLSLITIIPDFIHAETVLPAANGIKHPVGLKNWRVLSTSFRNDNNTQRVILGNSTAIKASRSGQIDPWPEGTILAKLVWKNIEHPQWKAAVVPGEFVHSEIMVKDAVKYKTTGGWGFARWKGTEQQPYGKDNSFDQECFSCHTHAKDSGYVFTIPPKIP